MAITASKCVYKIGNLKMNYLVKGEGPLIILLHSFGGSSENWSQNLDALAENHKIFAVDLPGFGESDLPESEDDLKYYFIYVANILEDLLIEQGIQKTSFIGNSMGGGIALQFLLQFPNMVEKIVLVDSVCLGKEISAPYRLLSIPYFGELLLQISFSKIGIRKTWETMFYGKNLIPESFEKQTSIWARKAGRKEFLLKTARYGIDLKGQRGTYLADLSKITVPTLIIWGEDDRLLPVSHAYAAHKLIPGAELSVFTKCGHLPQIEKMDEFNRQVTLFLR